MNLPSFKIRLWWLLPVLPVALLLYYGIGMELANVIDADPEFGPGTVAPGQSRAVAIASRLVLREVDGHKWVANDPFFTPSAALDDMAHYQIGIVGTVARFTNQMRASCGDDDGEAIELIRASGFFKYPPNVWKFDPSTSWAPTASSEKQYRAAARNLSDFNDRLGSGETRCPRDTQALTAMLRVLGDEMDRIADRLDEHLDQPRWLLLDGKADDLFYDAKGRTYALSLLLRELGWDFATIISQADLGDDWQAMLESLRLAAGLEPLVVIAGHDDSTFLPNHLANQGFRLLQARSKLARVAARLGDAEAH